MTDLPEQLTDILRRFDRDDPVQFDRVFSMIYAELRQLAAVQFRGESPAHTLQPTALVNEAYLKLVRGEQLGWESRAHFFGAAARAMRQILIDHARVRDAKKRGGEWRRVTLAEEVAVGDATEFDLIDLHNALEKLESLDEQRARIVELRFFAGLTLDETADALGISRRKVAGDWKAIRLWLAKELAR